MEQLNKERKIIAQYCELLGVDLKINTDMISTFRRMHWSIDDEIHVFSFTTYLFLIDKFNLPLFYVSTYPESTIKAIKTFIAQDKDQPLFDILVREYNLVDNGYQLSALLSHFTLTMLEMWKFNINPNII